jgi:diguanylate cyclase (GGDEF)-like protein
MPVDLTPSDSAPPRAEPPMEPDLTLPRVAAALRATSQAASLLAVATGVLVILGWALDVETLKRLVPGLTAMNPATAVGMICLGMSLAFVSRSEARRAGARASALALAAFTIGLTRLAAVIGLWDLEIDRLLFAEKLGTADFGGPNRMAPNTAVNFALLGGALFAIDRPIAGRYWLAQLLAIIAAMTSLLAIMGYAYGLPSFYGIGAHIPMALPTAVAFHVIAAGVLCARPTRGFMAVICSDSSGGAMVRRLLPAVLIIPAVLGALRLAGDRAMMIDAAFGLWLLAVAIMTLFATLVGWNAHLLFRSDVDRAHAQQVLAYQATHDALTELPNRRLFIEQLSRELGRAQETGTSVAVLFVDLDLFKIVNDSLGHVVGDELLVAAARKIEGCLDEGDLVGRLSGDEFTVLLPGVTGVERPVAMAERIRHAFDEPFAIGLHEAFTSVSIGIAVSTGQETPLDLIRHADIAMYRAKARGKARHEIFDPRMDQFIRQRQRLETDLRRALVRGELRVYYQPEVEIETGRLVGLEALVRWEHPQRGLIAPAEFLAVAEETGLIVPIGRWVLFEACRQAKEWQTSYHRDLALLISVNLSGKHLQQATLVEEVRDVLETTGLDPSHLILEITETVAMAGAETTIEILTRLKALGVQLAIDDFGTGFSSLSYLKRFPVDLLKIDKSFVDGVALRGHDTAIVEAIIALGHALGLQVIAEGVETPDQLEELRALGSELGQGYFFGRPLSDDEEHGMPLLLHQDRRWPSAGGSGSNGTPRPS